MADWLFTTVCVMVVLVALLLCLTYISIQVNHTNNVFTIMSKLMVASNTNNTVIQLNGNAMEDPIKFQCIRYKPTTDTSFKIFGDAGGKFKAVIYCYCKQTTAVISPCVYLDDGEQFIYLNGDPKSEDGGIFLGDNNNPLAIPTIFKSFDLTTTVTVVRTPVLYSNLLNAPNIVPRLRELYNGTNLQKGTKRIMNLPEGVTKSGDDSYVPAGKRIIRVNFNGKPIFEVPLFNDNLKNWGKIHFNGMLLYRDD